MNSIRCLHAFTGRLLALVFLAVFLGQPGCVSTNEVRSIVAESNAAVLAAEVAGIELDAQPGVGGTAPDWRTASRKIDEFIAAHPGEAAAASALRVRQAMLFIVHGEYERARYAFGEATVLHTGRDRALKALAEPVIWWWEHSLDTSWTASQCAQATSHLSAFDREIAGLDGSPDARDLLAEMRVRMGLKLSKSLQASQGRQEALVDAINRYATIFTPEDVEALSAGTLTVESPAISTAQRRRLRALAVLDLAREAVNSLVNDEEPPVLVAVDDFAPEARPFAALFVAP